MLWKILADAVMGLHLLLIGFFAVSVVLLALGFFQRTPQLAVLLLRGHRIGARFGSGVLGWGIKVLLPNRPGIRAEKAL